MNNKRLDDGWISEQLKDRWMDQGAIEGTMDGASGGWIRRLYIDGTIRSDPTLQSDLILLLTETALFIDPTLHGLLSHCCSHCSDGHSNHQANAVLLSATEPPDPP